jgi:hypothetical protein
MVWPMPFHESLAALDADGGRRNKPRIIPPALAEPIEIG